MIRRTRWRCRMQISETSSNRPMRYGGVISPFRSQRSSQLWPSFHRNTCPLINRQFLLMPAIASISSSVNGWTHGALQIARYSMRRVEKGMGICPRCTAHFTQTTAGCTSKRSAMPTITGSSISTVSSASIAVRTGRRADRAKADRLDAVVAHEVEQLGLLKMRVQFHLVARRLDSASRSSSLSLGTVMLEVPICRPGPSPPASPSAARSS